MKFFEVAAKCGHVGRDKYYEGHFFVRAADAKSASEKVKDKPRVKKHHEDVILWIKEVDESAYLKGTEEWKNNPYFHCNSKWEQKTFLPLIQDGIKPETELQLKYRQRKNRYYKNKNCTDKPSKHRGIRNLYKYTKYNAVYEETDLYIA